MKSRGTTGRFARSAARKNEALAAAKPSAVPSSALTRDLAPHRDHGHLTYRASTKCRICGNLNLVKVLDLGHQCLTGVFPSLKSPQVGSGPVELVKCMGDDPREFCGLVQMHHSFAAEDMYGDNYGYRSGLN